MRPNVTALLCGLALSGALPRLGGSREDDLRGTPLEDLELGPNGIQRKPPVVPQATRLKPGPQAAYNRITRRSDEDILERQGRQRRKLIRRAWDAGQRYGAGLIERDSSTGQFMHPHLPEPPANCDDDFDLAPLVHAQGYEIRQGPEPEFEEEVYEDGYFEALAAWQPEPPAGEGWKLAAVLDTEDGPQAWWVRPLGAES